MTLRPMAYASRAMTPTEQIEEALATTWSLDRFFSPIAFIAGQTGYSDVAMSKRPASQLDKARSSSMYMSKFVYADDAALVDDDAAIATIRVTAISAGSLWQAD